MANLSLVFDILAKDQASPTFRRVGDEAERSGRKAESGLGSIVGAAKVAGAALLGAGIITGFRELYDAAAESARISRLTESAIRSTGGAAGVSADQVGDLAAAISAKTGIDDEAIQSGQNLLLTFTNIRNEAGAGNDIFDQTSQIMADMSTVMGTDASGSAIQLGKALNDPIKGIGTLSRAGVQFTEQQKEQIRTLVESGDTLGAQQVILAELTTQFGGAAEAAGTPLDKMKVSVGNIAETVGAFLIPVVDDFATTGLTAIESVAAGFETGEVSADGFAGVMQGVGAAIGDVVDAGQAVAGAGGNVVDFVSSIPGPATAAVGALGAFVLLKGPVGDALETVALKSLYARDSVSGLSGRLGGVKGAASGLLGVLGGPFGIALAGTAAGVAYVSSEMADADAQTESWTQSILNGTSAADGLNEAYLAQYGGEKPDWLQQQSELLGFTSSLEDAEANARELYGAMDPLAQAQQNVTYDTNRLVAAIDEFGEGSPEATQAAELLAASNERLAGRQDAVTRATEQASTAMAAAQPTTEDFATTTEALQLEVSDAKDMVDAFRLALDQLGGNVVNTTELEGALFTATQAATGALEGTTGAVLDASGALNTQSTAGVAAADVLFGVRDAGFDLLSNQAQLGESTEQLTGRANDLRARFIETAGQMGINVEEANRLADQYGLIPTQVVTEVTADTGPADTAVREFVTRVSGTRVSLTGNFVGGAGVVVKNAMGNLLEGGTASIVPPNTWRVIGDRLVDDEAYIPINGDQRSTDILTETARRMGYQLAPADVALFAAGGILGGLSVPVELSGLPRSVTVDPGVVTAGGVAGDGAVGGSWQSIFNYVKARVPQARQNSTYRPGDPGYHGRNKAVDFGFGSGPGGAGSAGLALINRVLHDGLGANLAELIYDGIGDNRPDLKNGRPLTYSAGTRAQHRNHVHAAVYDGGGTLQPGYTLAYNGTGQGETIRTAEQEAELARGGSPTVVNIQVDRDAERIARAVSQAQRDDEFLHG